MKYPRREYRRHQIRSLGSAIRLLGKSKPEHGRPVAPRVQNTPNAESSRYAVPALQRLVPLKCAYAGGTVPPLGTLSYCNISTIFRTLTAYYIKLSKVLDIFSLTKLKFPVKRISPVTSQKRPVTGLFQCLTNRKARVL